MKKQYRELVELKGLIRERKTTYEKIAKEMKMSLSAFCNKINGKTIFDISQVTSIAEILEIPREKIHIYFF